MRYQTKLSSLFCEDLFHVDFALRGSEQKEFLLELEDWIIAGTISSGAGRLTYFNVSVAAVMNEYHKNDSNEYPNTF